MNACVYFQDCTSSTIYKHSFIYTYTIENESDSRRMPSVVATCIRDARDKDHATLTLDHHSTLFSLRHLTCCIYKHPEMTISYKLQVSLLVEADNALQYGYRALAFRSFISDFAPEHAPAPQAPPKKCIRTMFDVLMFSGADCSAAHLERLKSLLREARGSID